MKEEIKYGYKNSVRHEIVYWPAVKEPYQNDTVLSCDERDDRQDMVDLVPKTKSAAGRNKPQLCIISKATMGNKAHS